MARRIPLLALLLGISLPQPATAESLTVGGTVRTYQLFVPPGGRGPRPTVVLLHGRWGWGGQLRRSSGFDRVAARRGFVAVYPDGLAHRWNDGRQPDRNGANDAGFLLALIDRLIAGKIADPRRIYLGGHSNGAILAERMACEHADRLAGFFLVAGAQPANLPCHPSRALPAIFFHGTADRLVPYAGGAAGDDRGRVLSFDQTVALWTRANGCGGAKPPQLLDRVPSDATAAEIVDYAGCRAPLRRVTLRGAGHGWPGAHNLVLRMFTGPETAEIDASEGIGEFFTAARP